MLFATQYMTFKYITIYNIKIGNSELSLTKTICLQNIFTQHISNYQLLEVTIILCINSVQNCKLVIEMKYL